MIKRIDNPRVSVIIPTYNRAQDLRRCLDSLTKQTMQDFEVLVCDDGSTDKTAEIPKDYFHLLDIIYDYAKNFGGPAHPRNRGIKLARASYIAFLDSDDWWTPTKLEESVKHLEQGSDIVYHDLFLVNKTDQKIFWKKAHTRQVIHPVFKDLLTNGNALNNSSVVVKKELLNQINGLSEDPNLIAAEDYDAWLRIAQLTEKFKKIPQTLGYYWAGGGNMSGPTRTLKNLHTLENLYANDINNLNITANFGWLNYSKGRANYLLGSYELAKKDLGLILQKKISIIIKIKTLWMLLRIRIKHS